MAALAAVLCACAGQIPSPTPLQARRATQQWPGTTLEALRQGRALYIAKCSGCHTLRLPSAYSPERWELMLERMQQRSQISDAEKERIRRYILSVKIE